LDHPFGHAASDATALAEPGHDADGDPIVPHARHRPDQGIAVGAEGEGAIDDVLYTRACQGWHALERDLQTVGDSIKIRWQEFMAKIEWRPGHRPGDTVGFICAQQYALALLPGIGVAFVVDGNSDLPAMSFDFRNRL